MYTVMEQFACHPYLRYAETLVDGYTRELMLESSLKSIYSASYIFDLCAKYYYDEEHAYDQLANTIFIVSKQFNKRCLSDKFLKLIIAKYLKLDRNDDYERKLSIYCDKLLQLKYIMPIDRIYEKMQFYMFTMSALAVFDRSR